MADPKKIRIKRGLTAGNVPSGLAFGELAINTFDRNLFVGGITGSVLDYPLQKTYVYNTYDDFVLDINAGVYGTAGNESWFQYGDLFIERNSKVQYAFLPSTTGPTSIGTWFPITATGTPAPPESFVPGISETVLIQSYENSGAPVNPDHGALWFNTDTGVLYTYIAGETGAFANAWVQATVINNTIQELPS